jgi:ATP-binding cassette subfamily B protein
MYVGPAVMYTIIIRFTIVIAYMYNVSPRLTLYTILHLPCHMQFTNWVQKLTEEHCFPAISIKSISFTQKYFGIRVIKAYSLEDQHQNNMVNLAKESKEKVCKSTILFGPLMLGLIGINKPGSDLFWRRNVHWRKVEHPGTIAEFIYMSTCLLGLWHLLGWISSMVQKQKRPQMT